MFRFLARAFGLILIAAGFVGLVIDGTRSIANGGIMFTPIGEAAYRVFGERYLLLQPAIERHIHPALCAVARVYGASGSWFSLLTAIARSHGR